jgi:hypothetical protein
MAAMMAVIFEAGTNKRLSRSVWDLDFSVGLHRFGL